MKSNKPSTVKKEGHIMQVVVKKPEILSREIENNTGIIKPTAPVILNKNNNGMHIT